MATEPSGQAPDAARPTQLSPDMTDPVAIQAAMAAIRAGKEVSVSPEGVPIVAEAMPAAPLEAPASPAPTEPVTPAEPPAGSTPPVEPGTPGEPLDGRILPSRISTQQFEPEAQRAMALQHSLNNGKKHGEPGFVSLSEALKQVQAADNPAPANEPVPDAQPTQLETLGTKLQSTEQKLAELRAQRAERSKEGELYGEDLNALNEQIENTIQELAEVKAEKKLAERDEHQTQAQREQAEYNRKIAKREEAKGRALELYPTAGDETKPLGQEVKRYVAELKKPGHPDASILTAENAAIVVAERAAMTVAQRMVREQPGVRLADALESLMAPPPAAPAGQPAAAPVKVLPGMGRQMPTPVLPPKTAADVLADVGTDPVKIAAALAATRNRALPAGIHF